MKFATYTRDSATGNDYADQRYYTSVLGRFMTPDRYESRSGGPADPLNPKTWNRYSYVVGDPINLNDPSGRYQCSPDNPYCVPPCDPFDPFCSPGPPVPMPPTIDVEVSCDIKVFEQPIPATGGFGAHTYIQTDVQVTVNGAVISDVYQIFEATNIPKSDPNSQCTALMSLTAKCWLNNVSSTAFLNVGNGPPPKPNNPNNPSFQIWDSGFNEDNCSKILSIQLSSGLFSDNTFTYAYPYTSNSFVYTLLKVAGVPVDDVSAGAEIGVLVGWGLTIPLFP